MGHLPLVQAALALVERHGRYLICRRRVGDVLGGYWEFPGGKRKVGEPWEACLRRELREELGVTVRVISPYGRFRHRSRARPTLFRVFRCAIARGTPRPLAASALRWVWPRQLMRYRFPPANQQLIAQLSSLATRHRSF